MRGAAKPRRTIANALPVCPDQDGLVYASVYCRCGGCGKAMALISSGSIKFDSGKDASTFMGEKKRRECELRGERFYDHSRVRMLWYCKKCGRTTARRLAIPEVSPKNYVDWEKIPRVQNVRFVTKRVTMTMRQAGGGEAS